MSIAQREEAASGAAYRAIEASGGDPIAAMRVMERDPSTAKSLSLRRDHYYAAAQRFRERKQPNQASGSNGNKYTQMAQRAAGGTTQTPQPLPQRSVPPSGINLQDEPPSLQQLWDDAASEMKAAGHGSAEIVQTLGNRP